MAREGFLVRVCDSFHGLNKGAFIRLAVRTEVENAAFAQAFARVVEKEGPHR
jgi:histidinol-phosphate/aromatic aminotransferase/cobyric acid decarboxylase-like protein